jgi:hypothetical protein
MFESCRAHLGLPAQDRSAGAPNVTVVGRLPDFLDRRAHVEIPRRAGERWFRRVGLAVLVALCALALANVFGQATAESTVEEPDATLTLRAPSAMRSGLVYQVMFRVEARRGLEEPTIVLDPGWFESYTINAYQPEPVEWIHRDGRNALVYGPIAAGRRLVARVQYQVNPTAIGPRTQHVVLEDAGEPIARLEHDAFVYP